MILFCVEKNLEIVLSIDGSYKVEKTGDPILLLQWLDKRRKGHTLTMG